MSEQTDQTTAAEAPPDESLPTITAEMADKFARARDMGISGDPDAPPGYVVDENHVPNALDVGTLNTTEIHGISSYDLPRHTGVFHPDAIPDNPYDAGPAVPPAGASDYDPGSGPNYPVETPEEPVYGEPPPGEVEEVEEGAAEPAPKAVKATKATKAPSPAGTKDTALEPTPEAPSTP